MPHRSHAVTATVCAKDARRLTDFYAAVLCLERAEEGETFVVLASEAVQLAIVLVPPAIAETILVADPPEVREETPIKRSFPVDDAEGVRLRQVVPLYAPTEVRSMATLPTIIPISDLRQDTAGVIKRVVASDEPVVITQRGRATAVLVSADAYERSQHENEILRALARGDAEIAAGVGRDAEDVMAEARALLSSE